ncbi:cytochrome b5-like heme/steroid binding domain-containing protein [Aspergillus pseudoustus]|uniref:Cytochrome b5-like heme/steroid binding domain-containing protein n=1 Tax=Aspergillus pseudoustus TaxID=1810923 RepID=A0ABR4KP94_9EURO
MGWLTLRRRADALPATTATPVPAHSSTSTSEKLGAYAEHTEDISDPTQQLRPQANLQHPKFLDKTYPLADPSTPDSALPYIAAKTLITLEEEYKATPETLKPRSPIWIVIDNIVYDGTEFIHEHPGGSVVINSFVGQDCSWQFWRFHSKQHMQEYGRALRVGSTEGVRNRFKEPARYVGLGALDEGW